MVDWDTASNPEKAANQMQLWLPHKKWRPTNIIYGSFGQLFSESKKSHGDLLRVADRIGGKTKKIIDQLSKELYANKRPSDSEIKEILLRPSDKEIKELLLLISKRKRRDSLTLAKTIGGKTMTTVDQLFKELSPKKRPSNQEIEDLLLRPLLLSPSDKEVEELLFLIK
jgi:gas vesicle protein